MINDNIIPIWKKPGLSSFEVVDKVKYHNKNVKVGHCGTLDPFAEGVLIVCKGDQLKNIEQIMYYPKEYEATITFGFETDTLDKTGEIIKTDTKSLKFKEDNIKSILKKFTGDQLQVPPYFSALKFKGKSLYKYARKGIFIRKRPRKIHIHDLKFISYNDNKLKVYVKCSKGTYIRSLSKDIALSLKTYGYLSSLTRVAVGPFNRSNSFQLETLYN